MARSRVPKTSRWLVAIPAGVGGLVFGTIFGAAAAALAAAAGGGAPRELPLLIGATVGGFAYLYRAWVVEGSGELARRMFMGADQGTAPEYSAARALEARGRYEEAVALYLEGAEDYPEEPEPLLLAARLLSGPLGRPDDALAVLRRARSIPKLPAASRIPVDQALVDLYEHDLGQPALALPILARLAEEQAGNRVGSMAESRMRLIRAALRSA